MGVARVSARRDGVLYRACSSCHREIAMHDQYVTIQASWRRPPADRLCVECWFLMLVGAYERILAREAEARQN